MSRLILTTRDMLVLRDGRPFGESGTFGGSSFDWPRPQTIAGMCRTAVGLGRGEGYFGIPEGCGAVMKIGISRLLAELVVDGQAEPLIPTPADMVFTDQGGAQRAWPLVYRPLSKGEGTDLEAKEWLYPSLAASAKPAKPPMFIRQPLAKKYLEGTLPPDGLDLDPLKDFVPGPVREFRVHTAIDPESHAVSEGRLYAESGIRLTACGQLGGGSLGDLQIGFELEGLAPGEALPQSMYLGGDRRRVDVSVSGKSAYPAMPQVFGEDRLLKLVLTTHGDFGGWAPLWLVPGADPSNVAWVKEPRSGIEMRLRSAVVPGWDPASGWDYEKRGPKPFRKLARPGSIYLVEVKDPSRSSELASALWGSSVCASGSQQERDGYGQVIIAKA